MPNDSDVRTCSDSKSQASHANNQNASGIVQGSTLLMLCRVRHSMSTVSVISHLHEAERRLKVVEPLCVGLPVNPR